MKIVFAASEAAPLIKTGGLGDVAQALPLALSEKKGQEVILFLPYYKKMKENKDMAVDFIASFDVSLSWRKQYCGLFRVRSRKRKLKIYLIDNEYYFNRDVIYGHGDDGERFAFFSKAILESLCRLGVKPDIIHANDWQTALVPVFLHAFYHKELGNAKTVFTIHNIEYQGWAHPYFLGDTLGLSSEYENCLSFRGSLNFLKGAILSSDAITTVSESYARELCDAAFAHGLENILSEHAFKLHGIVNGIDLDTNSPAKDKNLPLPYSVENLAEGKKAAKEEILKITSLDLSGDAPLVGMVSRLVSHKGLDLFCDALEDFMSWNARFVVLGTGDTYYEEKLASLAERFPDRFALIRKFSPALASLIYAASDMYMMPSKSEPCGLSQMIAMRYGTVPLVHETGGLRDTVPPYNKITGEGLGFSFTPFSKDALYCVFREALTLFATDKEAWSALVKRDMETDLSWKKGAEKYLTLYHTLCGEK